MARALSCALVACALLLAGGVDSGQCPNFDAVVTHAIGQLSHQQIARDETPWFYSSTQLTVRLKAEAKSGSTWVGNLVKDILQGLCLQINAHCPGSCTVFVDERWYPSGRVSWITWRRGCDTNEALNHSDSNFITFIEGHKHVIPYIPQTHHPNMSPFHTKLPGWLQGCVARSEFKCWPSRDSMVRLAANMLREQRLWQSGRDPTSAEFVQARITALDPALLRQWELATNTSAPPMATQAQHGTSYRPIPRPRSVRFLSLLRDPRAIAMSAAKYTPGRILFGVPRRQEFGVESDSAQNQRNRLALRDDQVADFAVGFMNVSAAWTMFRHFWLGPSGPLAAAKSAEVIYEALSSSVRAALHGFVLLRMVNHAVWLTCK